MDLLGFISTKINFIYDTMPPYLKGYI